jgi:hypothetical protein
VVEFIVGLMRVYSGGGHELPPPVWDVFVPRLVQQTAR